VRFWAGEGAGLAAFHGAEEDDFVAVLKGGIALALVSVEADGDPRGRMLAARRRSVTVAPERGRR
jgi:hypothetical protein